MRVVQFGNLESYMREWEQSAYEAFQANPTYALRWYTVKSLALVGVTAALVYVLATRKK